MYSKADVLAVLPPFKNEVKLVTWRQSTDRLIKEIIKAHEKYQGDYDLIYPLFDRTDIYQTCSGLWDFCKYNMVYTIESEDEQSVKSPAAILQKGQKTDCKHYSLFIGGILDAIKTNEGDGWEWCYRFASYDSSKIIEHVFIVVKDSRNEIWVDPVLSGFNQKKKPTFYEDIYIPMAVYSISGIGGDAATTIEVDKETAEIYWLVMINQNYFGLKTMLNDNPNITYGLFRDWYITEGYDFNQLELILKG
jgi:hypothetical protein